MLQKATFSELLRKGGYLMGKSLHINTGNAMLLNENSEMLSVYDSVNINAGTMVVSRKVYEKLTGMGVSLNSGNMNIIDVTGKLTELAGNTTITASMSYKDCFLVCDGNIIVEDAKGLDGVTGLYAKRLFHAESVDLGGIMGVGAMARTVYPDNAKLHIGNMTIDGTSRIILNGNTLYWVHGAVKALDGVALEEMRLKGTTFHCESLIIRIGLFEKYSALFTADRFTFIPDDHNVVDDITLDSATALLHGEKLFVLGDLMVPYDQEQYLKGLSSLIINGTVTMPITAVAEFKAIGKANDYEVYEGILMPVNGFQTLGHEQCQTAIERGIKYTLKINGALYFMSDVTAQDMDAIAAVHCNGLIGAPDRARGMLDGKVKNVNGIILDIDAMIKKFYGDDFALGDNPIGMIQKLISQIQGGGDGSTINSGSFKL